MLNKVVIICDSAELTGGAEKIALTTANILAQRDIGVVFFCAGGKPDHLLANENILVVSTKQDRFGIGDVTIEKMVRGLWNKQAYSVLRNLLASYKADSTIVHVHSWGSSLSPSIFKAIRESGIKCVVTGHDYLLSCPNSHFFNYRRRCACDKRPYSLSCFLTNCDKDDFLRNVYRRIRGLIQRYELNKLQAALVCITEFQKEVMMRFSAGMFESVHVVNNPFPTGCNRRINCLNPGRGFIYVGRLAPGKGIDLFCEAVTKEHVKGIVYGTGELESEMKDRYPEVDFRGWGSPTELARAMPVCRALVFPSEFYEVAPLAPYEAKIYGGIPSIVASGCAAASYIDNGTNGLLFSSGDIDDLRRCLRTLMSDEVACAMKSAISDEVSTGIPFSDRDYGDALLKLYSGMLV